MISLDIQIYYLTSISRNCQTSFISNFGEVGYLHNRSYILMTKPVPVSLDLFAIDVPFSQLLSSSNIQSLTSKLISSALFCFALTFATTQICM